MTDPFQKLPPDEQPPPQGQPGQQPPPYGQAGQPSPYGQPGQPYPQAPGDELTWVGAAHWSALIAAFVGGFAFLGPLVVLLVKGSSSPRVRWHAVESLNFQLSMLIYGLVAGISMLALIGFVLLPIVLVLWLVFTIIGSLKASRGEDYKYPLTIRMVH